LVSTGTERAVRHLASANLLNKARARPDLVRAVLRKASADGLGATVTAMRSRLDEEMPLGYSGVGVAVTVGSAVPGVRPGMRVATASAGHGDYQIVPGLLAVPVPDDVDDVAAAFGAVAGVALQGIRQADVGVGSCVVVVGLGLVGQLTMRLAGAAGLTAIGVDLREWPAHLAHAAGAAGLVERGEQTTAEIMELTRGRGADAVLITAATGSSEPIRRAARIARDRGRIVVVGDVGLELDRRPCYERELELRFARSYGPGRYDRTYEEWAVDYPVGHVRWTAARNIETYLDLVARKSVSVSDLVTHVFSVDDAAKAYEVLETDPRVLGIQLTYTAPDHIDREVIRVAAPPRLGRTTAGIVGAGHYARATFLPALRDAGWADDLVAVTSASGASASFLARRHGIEQLLGSVDEMLACDGIATVFILSRHDSHADLTVRALDAGKHVFVEKPLALTNHELDAVVSAYNRNRGDLFVGFNRRYSPAITNARAALSVYTGPLAITYRVNAGPVPASHWYNDRRQGGRILGEVCHFVDLASWLVGSQPCSVHAVGSGHGELALDPDVAILLGYTDGSTAAVSYSTAGHASTPKERLEILGRGRTVVIDDFRSLVIDGRRVKGIGRDKGHAELLRRVRAALASGERSTIDTDSAIGTTATMLDVLAALGSVR
jgi:predicted dehydrogenase/threonine dehydrogenase-like Zn-dependent dehydrogenase